MSAASYNGGIENQPHKVTYKSKDRSLIYLWNQLNTVLNGGETVKPTVVQHTAIILFLNHSFFFFISFTGLVSLHPLLYCANKTKRVISLRWGSEASFFWTTNIFHHSVVAKVKQSLLTKTNPTNAQTQREQRESTHSLQLWGGNVFITILAMYVLSLSFSYPCGRSYVFSAVGTTSTSDIIMRAYCNHRERGLQLCNKCHKIHPSQSDSAQLLWDQNSASQRNNVSTVPKGTDSVTGTTSPTVLGKLGTLFAVFYSSYQPAG